LSSYTITNGGVNVKIVNKSGICYGTNTTPTILNSNYTVDAATNGVSTATFNSVLSALTPNTTYYARAYAITQVDTVYGSIVNFTTLPQSVPSLKTSLPTSVLSNKATTGGNTIDSGGYSIMEKGVCYALSNNPSYSGFHTSDGIGNADFVSVLKGLQPNTKYYVKAYAKNQLGLGYGNLDSLVTSAPVPSIIATPGNLDFGDVTYNTTAPILSYKINATYLTPAGGTISLSVNNGYTISATINGSYNPNLVIPYTNSTIANKIIYVKSPSNSYGALTGRVLHSGVGLFRQMLIRFSCKQM